MSKHDEDIVAEIPCACGCGENLKLKRRHFFKSHLKEFPRFIKGHQQFGNKRGWKGGLIKDFRGYVWVYSPDHPFKNAMGAGYVKRARLVMERKLGRYLLPTEIVHHINGIKDDDKKENLLVTNLSSHQSEHQKETVKHMKRNSDGKFIKCRDYGYGQDEHTCGTQGALDR